MLIEILPDYLSARKVALVAECLRDGGVIIFPTDTVYAFGCDLNNKKALDKIVALKGKSKNEAHFSIICYDISQLSEYVSSMSNPTFRLMKQVLPGPYTFILPANKSVPRIFDFKKKTIGIRIPDHNLCRELVKELGNPIIAASLHDDFNLGTEYYSDPAEIYRHYGKLVDIVLDGGPGGQIASTVIEATEVEPVLVREGKGAELIVE